MTQEQKIQLQLGMTECLIAENEKTMVSLLKSMDDTLFNLRNNGTFDPRQARLFGQISYMESYMSKISETKKTLENLGAQRRMLENLLSQDLLAKVLKKD